MKSEDILILPKNLLLVCKSSLFVNPTFLFPAPTGVGHQGPNHLLGPLLNLGYLVQGGYLGSGRQSETHTSLNQDGELPSSRKHPQTGTVVSESRRPQQARAHPSVPQDLF